MTWRDLSRRTIEAVFLAHQDADEKEMRKHLSAAYPFGERAMHPYKVWLDECKKQVRRRFDGPGDDPILKRVRKPYGAPPEQLRLL